MRLFTWLKSNLIQSAGNGLDVENGMEEGATAGAVAIDEDLFGGDDEDLEDLEEQLDDMDLES